MSTAENIDNPSDKAVGQSLFATLKHRTFRNIWLAGLVSNIGTWMQEIGAGWLMTSLAPSPLMVSAVQAAAVFPVFLLAIPAGALADIVDRRKLLVFSISWLFVVALALALLTFLELTSAGLLLVCTFALGIGTALMTPAFMAAIPDLVPKEQLLGAVTLNSIAINSARAVGPAVAGLLVAWAGSGFVFLLNAASFLVVLVAVVAWKSTARSNTLKSERFISAVRVGLVYARETPEIRKIIIRGVAFFIFASASWALLPLYVQQELQRGPHIYGMLLGALGLGAVGGGLYLPQLRQRISIENIVRCGTLMFVVVAFALAFSRHLVLLAFSMFCAGVAWIWIMSSLQSSLQHVLPDWVRARVLAVFMAIYMGAMAIGSISWGQMASSTSIPTALTLSAICGLLLFLITLRSRLKDLQNHDFSPSYHWAELDTVIPQEYDRGPFMTRVEYLVEPENVKNFINALESIRRVRLRNGAISWSVYQDVANSGRFIEVFLDDCWREHLRQHDRFSVSDREVQRQVQSHHSGEGMPDVSHYVAVDTGATL